MMLVRVKETGTSILNFSLRLLYRVTVSVSALSRLSKQSVSSERDSTTLQSKGVIVNE